MFTAGIWLLPGRGPGETLNTGGVNRCFVAVGRNSQTQKKKNKKKTHNTHTMPRRVPVFYSGGG